LMEPMTSDEAALALPRKRKGKRKAKSCGCGCGGTKAACSSLKARMVALVRGRGGKLVSKRSKTQDPACSQAMSTWKTTGMTSAVAAVLGKCRSKARQLKNVGAHRAAGNEGRAQSLEARAARGLGAGERTARAKELRAARTKGATAQAKPAGDQLKPGTRQMLASSRELKQAHGGNTRVRAAAFAERAKATVQVHREQRAHDNIEPVTRARNSANAIARDIPRHGFHSSDQIAAWRAARTGKPAAAVAVAKPAADSRPLWKQASDQRRAKGTPRERRDALDARIKDRLKTIPDPAKDKRVSRVRELDAQRRKLGQSRYGERETNRRADVIDKERAPLVASVRADRELTANNDRIQRLRKAQAKAGYAEGNASLPLKIKSVRARYARGQNPHDTAGRNARAATLRAARASAATPATVKPAARPMAQGRGGKDRLARATELRAGRRRSSGSKEDQASQSAEKFHARQDTAADNRRRRVETRRHGRELTPDERSARTGKARQLGMDRRNAGEAARARVDGQAREKAIHDKAAALRAVRAADDKGTPGWRMSVLGRRLKDRLPAALAADDDSYTVLVNRRNKIADTMRRRFGDRLTDSPPRYDQHVARLAARRAARTPAAAPATVKPAAAVAVAKPAGPSLRDQAQAHRAGKGPDWDRAGRLAARAKKVAGSAKQSAKRATEKGDLDKAVGQRRRRAAALSRYDRLVQKRYSDVAPKGMIETTGRVVSSAPATSKNPALDAAMNKHGDRVQSALAAAPAAGPRPPALRRLHAIGKRANDRLQAARPAGPPRSRAEAQVETARKEAMAMSQRLMNPVDHSLAGYEDAYARQLRKRLTELRSARSKA